MLNDAQLQKTLLILTAMLSALTALSVLQDKWRQSSAEASSASPHVLQPHVSVLQGSQRQAAQLRPPASAALEAKARELAHLNRHLQTIDQQIELRQLQAAVDNAQFAPELQDSSWPIGSDQDRSADSYGVNLEQENAAEKVYLDLYGSTASRYQQPYLPADQVNSRLAINLWLAKLEHQERAEYIRTFIRNANNAGYDVILNERLEVVGLRPLKQKNKLSIDQALSKFYGSSR